MIIVIRRWLKSGGFQVVLWVILAIVAVIFLMPNVPQFSRRSSTVLATINGQDLTDDMLNRKALAIEDQMQEARRQWGRYADAMLRMMGLKSNPKEVAFDRLVQDSLIDGVAKQIGFGAHPDFTREKLRDPQFLQSISDLIPPYAFDATGISEQALTIHLQRFGLSMTDLNEELSNAIKRNLVSDMITVVGYTPSFEVNEQIIIDNAPRKFSLFMLNEDNFYAKEKGKNVSKEDLRGFFNRENSTLQRYIVPEKRLGLTWRFGPQDYNVKVSSEEIEDYYNAHKVRLYSEKPAEVQVRRILFNVPNESELMPVLEKARKLREELVNNPDQFKSKARELSDDKESAAQGGLIAPFSRGTHNIEFEKAALLLKEDGDISQVVQTEKGVEIVQRVSRKAPTYKPLSTVSAEIKKKLEVRSFKEQFLQDMKELLEDGDITETELQLFIKRRGGSPKKVGPIEKDDSKLAQKLFRLKKDGIGFYIDGSVGVAVQLTDVQKKYTPELKTIENTVLDNLYHDRAVKRMQKELSDWRAKAVEQKSLTEVAKLAGVQVDKTDWISPSDKPKIEALRSKGVPIDMMLRLEKEGSILVHQDDENGYLIRLDEVKSLNEDIVNEKNPEAVSGLRWEQISRIGTGFVASLYRNAIIKTNETLPYSIEDSAE